MMFYCDQIIIDSTMINDLIPIKIALKNYEWNFGRHCFWTSAINQLLDYPEWILSRVCMQESSSFENYFSLNHLKS